MKLKMDENEEIDGNIIKIWFTPETPEETRLLEKLLKRIKISDPSMFKFVADWFEGITKKTPHLLLKFPKCWEDSVIP